MCSDSYRFSWKQIKHLCHLRRQYVQLYADSLQGSDIDTDELKEIEKDLDAKVILLWRYVPEISTYTDFPSWMKYKFKEDINLFPALRSPNYSLCT